MSSNTERLERMAVERDCAAERLDVACKGDAWALNCCGGDSLRSEAAFLRSLIPLVEAGERAQWTPIETAPKDGTRVLLWIRYGNHPAVGYWSVDRWSCDTEHYETSCGFYCQGGTPTTAAQTEPTHWQPLPAPSAEGGAG